MLNFSNLFIVCSLSLPQYFDTNETKRISCKIRNTIFEKKTYLIVLVFYISKPKKERRRNPYLLITPQI